MNVYMIFNKCYQPVDKEIWQGRIDDTDDFTAFRWHQWIELIDLTDENLNPIVDKKQGFCF